MTHAHPGLIKVVLFCGGRGSAALIRNLLQLPSVDLSLLINAYDDGLSTGDLRAFIPGMLGPSDFRKNLSYLIDLYSEGQYALQTLLEFRFPNDITDHQIGTLHAFAEGRGDIKDLSPELASLFAHLGWKTIELIKTYLKCFFDYAGRQAIKLKYSDCSLGNLVFAGAYLECSSNFNQTNRKLADLFGSQAKLVNVCSGDARTLVALKENGDILSREAEIVGPQNASPIRRFFFINKPLDATDIQSMANLSVEEKESSLKQREILPHGSPEAIEAIEGADIIIYGPGTQHSSLLPSYRVEGIGHALKRSRSRLKVFTVNLQIDHDIQSFDAQKLIDAALNCMEDVDNSHHAITHVFYNTNSQVVGDGIRLPQSIRDAGMVYKGAEVIDDHFENPAKPSVHSGSRIISRIFDLYYRDGKSREKETLDIYIDLVSRSVAVESLVQEFSEIEWRNDFEKVTLIINAEKSIGTKLPPHLAIKQTNRHSDFSEVAAFTEWLLSGTSDYLATLTGDGEYRLSDILLANTVLKSTRFGAVYGSRNQSRNQFRSSLHAAYGERTMIYRVSFFGAFMLSFLFALICGAIFTDPLTGFRLYHRQRLPRQLGDQLRRRRIHSAAAVTRALVREHVEIGEIPVQYRTFRGFTKAKWRLMRGMRNLYGIFG
jgi:2-phospho-L-lactate transferase/gluconeogenesis factor (CofD/UPF0052 family)